jgi:hypothetical protein
MAMAASTYPVQLDLDAPLKVANWRPIVHYFMAIPHIIVMYGLLIASFFVSVGAWFSILFTGKMSPGMFNFLVMTRRYQWRVTTFMYFMREPYPAFDFTSSATDPGGDPAHLAMEYPGEQSRLLLFIRGIMAIPHFIALIFLGIGMAVSVLIAFFAVLFTGKWPQGLRDFVVGVNRWATRLGAYVGLLTDVYPPFSLEP